MEVSRTAQEYPSRPRPQTRERAPGVHLGSWDRANVSGLALLLFLFSGGYATYAAGVLLLLVIREAIVRRRIPWDPSPLDLPLAFFLTVLVISGFLSEFPSVAFASISQFVLALLTGYGLAYCVLKRHPDSLTLLAAAWMAGALVPAAMGAYAFFAFPPAVLGVPGARTYLLTHTMLGTTLAVASLISIGAGLARRSRWVTLLALLAFTVTTAGLILTSSLGAWLGWACGALVLVVLTVGRRVSSRFLVGLVLVMLIIGMTALLARPLGMTRLLSGRGPSGPTRMYLWKVSLLIMHDHPWLGTGFGTFTRMYNRYLPRNAPYRENNPPSAHNIYVNMAVEVGLIGGGAFLLLVLAAARLGWRHVARHDDPEASGFFAGYLAVLVRELTDGTLLFYQIGIGFCVLLGVMAALAQRAGDRAPALEVHRLPHDA